MPPASPPSAYRSVCGCLFQEQIGPGRCSDTEVAARILVRAALLTRSDGHASNVLAAPLPWQISSGVTHDLAYFSEGPLEHAFLDLFAARMTDIVDVSEKRDLVRSANLPGRSFARAPRSSEDMRDRLACPAPLFLNIITFFLSLRITFTLAPSLRFLVSYSTPYPLLPSFPPHRPPPRPLSALVVFSSPTLHSARLPPRFPYSTSLSPPTTASTFPPPAARPTLIFSFAFFSPTLPYFPFTFSQHSPLSPSLLL